MASMLWVALGFILVGCATTSSGDTFTGCYRDPRTQRYSWHQQGIDTGTQCAGGSLYDVIDGGIKW